MRVADMVNTLLRRNRLADISAEVDQCPLSQQHITAKLWSSLRYAIRTGKYHMTRAGFAVAMIALVSSVALATEECCTSAQAQTQTTPPERTIWDHNGSVMYLVANGSSRDVYYQRPRQGMLDAGARPGSLLFRGEVN